jgi:predicted nucleotidyltransferase component of viral defense system
LIINGIKVDLVLHEYPYLEEIEIIDGIRLLSIQDIIPMKLQALAGRGVKKDFWDIYELLFHFDLNQMKDFHDRKYVNSDFGFILLSMSYFEDAEQQQENPIGLKGVNWEDVKIRISTAAKAFTNQRIF